MPTSPAKQKRVTSKTPTPAALAIVKNASPAVDATHDEQMGAQLMAQYRLAKEANRALVIFGAMLMQIREEQEPRLHARSRGGQIDGSEAKGTGLKGWLAKYAPEISEPTAYRFMKIAEAVRECCKLPNAIKNSAAKFAQFVQSQPELLEEKLRPQQLMLWEEVDSTSGRSWMDRIKTKRTVTIGGDTSQYRKDYEVPPYDIAQAHYFKIQVALFKAISPGQKQYLVHLPRATDEPDKTASLTQLISFTETLLGALKDALEVSAQ